jgi:hypothetical protein
MDLFAKPARALALVGSAQSRDPVVRNGAFKHLISHGHSIGQVPGDEAAESKQIGFMESIV